MITVSVVLVSRNHDWNISRLIESVLNKASPFLSIEVILVDSASTDATINIACKYHINVIRLNEDQRLTPAAGRYVGSQHATGTFVLFLDGDMELCDPWLEQALDVLVADPSIAVVSGKIVQKPRTFISAELDRAQPRSQGFLADTKDYGSSALYRRSVLQTVGTFNPYARSGEGIELCNRIRQKGHQVVILECPLAYRYAETDADLQPGYRPYLEFGKYLLNVLKRNVLPTVLF